MAEGLTRQQQQPQPHTHTRAKPRVSVAWHALLQRRHALLIAGLMLLGLALRLWFLSVNALDPRFSMADDGDYYERAQRFAITGQYLDDFWLIRPPLHVFLFALLLRISIILGDLTMGLALIRAVQIGLFLLTIPVGYDLARRLFNRRAGLIFAALLTVWYPLIELPIHTFSEPLFFVLFMLHLWLLLRWRDARHWRWLAGAGLALGLAALTRSPALYATTFVLGWLVLVTLVEPDAKARNPTGVVRAWLARLRDLRWLGRLARRWAVFLVAFVLVVGPWTFRNYLVYERFIPIDTLGPPNLWLDLLPNRRENIALLQTMPQADRQAFAVGELKRILSDDPLRLWQNAGPNFQHIWKAQFVEDFLFKSNFHTRPLRAVWPLGILGDLLWFGFTLCGLAALAAPLREGPFRLLLLGWLSYTVLTVLLLHVEPRYLMPIWLVLMLYAAWALSAPAAMLGMLRRNWISGGLALLLLAGFLTLFFSYRNYPEALARGVQREWHYLVGARAYAADNDVAAVAAFEQMVAADPRSIDGRVELARALLAQARYDEALAVLGDSAANRANVLRAAIARAQGNPDLAAAYFRDAARWEGEDLQELTLAWLSPPPTTYLNLGNDLDYGYLTGFSFGEQSELPNGDQLTYRWLQGQGRIALPLPEPLQPGSRVTLRMAGGGASTPLRLRFSDGTSTSVWVTGGVWRGYRLVVPPALAGQQHLTLTLDAPQFIPALQDAADADLRPLSLMISAVQVEIGTIE
jgi:4-amino-4-deoxy-L-arabinose transferase-like glycosyltransferase